MRRTNQHRQQWSAGQTRSPAARVCGWLIACPILLGIPVASADQNGATNNGGVTIQSRTDLGTQGDDGIEEAREFFFDDEIVPRPRPDDSLEFFMVNESAGSAADVGESGTSIESSDPSAPIDPEPTPVQDPQPLTMSDDWGPSPVPGSSAPVTAPLEYAGGGTDWSTVPAGGTVCPPSGLGQCVDDWRCNHQRHWVNWRLGSDYLQGCIPDGYNGFPMIYSTSPSLMYSSPLHSGGFIEPGGRADFVTRGGERLRKPMTELTTDISTTGNLPETTRETLEPRMHSAGTHRGWIGMAYYWDASHLAHQPLYFEDVNLERHGYSQGLLQPAVSAARFAGQFVLLPYALAAHPHYEAEYTLGEWRPGSAVPYVKDRPRPNLGGAAFEAAVITGLIFAVP